MKFLLKVLFALFPFTSVGASEINVPIHVNIVKSTNSSSLAIEYEQDVFSAVYRTSNQTFDNINIPFRVVSPISVTKQYHLTLVKSHHDCEATPITVNTTLDGSPIDENDQVRYLSFQHSGAVQQWREHKIALSFPEISQTLSDQRCQGNIGIAVELEV